MTVKSAAYVATGAAPWATAAGREAAGRGAHENEARERQEAAASRVRELGAREGERWFGDFAACVVAAVRAFNAEVGRDVVRVVTRNGGPELSVRCDGSNAFAWGSYVGRHEPCVYFAERLHGRDAMRSLPCTVSDDGDLAVLVAGEVLGPALAAERLFGPWLAGLDVDA